MKTTKFKFIAIAIILFMNVFSSFSQEIYYSESSFLKENCLFKYSLIKQNSDYYIIVLAESNTVFFTDEPTFLIKTSDKKIIELKGNIINKATYPIITSSRDNIQTEQRTTSAAQFKVSESELEMLKKGVSKVRLTMAPEEHEKSFRSDKIGKKLHKLYTERKKKEDNF